MEYGGFQYPAQKCKIDYICRPFVDVIDVIDVIDVFDVFDVIDVIDVFDVIDVIDVWGKLLTEWFTNWHLAPGSLSDVMMWCFARHSLWRRRDVFDVFDGTPEEVDNRLL